MIIWIYNIEGGAWLGSFGAMSVLGSDGDATANVAIVVENLDDPVAIASYFCTSNK